MKIAVLCLGRMGRAVAHRLQDGGHDLTVWNRSEGHADEFVQRGATEAASPHDAVGDVDVAISSLANDDAVRAVALGTNGVLEAMQQQPYLDASTISPQLSAELAAQSSRFVAMPILGAPQAVQDGTATYLVGGDASVIDGLQPMLTSLSDKVTCYERPEHASSAKLAVNLMMLSGIAALTEAFTVGRSGGLDDDQLTALLSNSPMLAPGLKNRFDAVLHASGPTWWTTTLAAKDAHLASDVAAADDKKLRLASTVHDLFQAAADSGHDGDDIVAVAQLYR